MRHRFWQQSREVKPFTYLLRISCQSSMLVFWSLCFSGLPFFLPLHCLPAFLQFYLQVYPQASSWSHFLVVSWDCGAWLCCSTFPCWNLNTVQKGVQHPDSAWTLSKELLMARCSISLWAQILWSVLVTPRCLINYWINWLVSPHRIFFVRLH